jgi:hypothetical protein
MMKKILIYLALCMSLMFPNLIYAEHFELDIYGLSYHLVGEGYRDAPRGLDDKAAWVFNPGIGITYDWRENYDDEGVAPLAMAGYFQDCDDRAFYFAGGGGRYRHKLADDLLFDLNFGMMYSYAQDWWESKYYGVWIPIANIGFSKPFWGRWWTYRVTYAPENTGISATSGGDLLFMNISMQL